jgi:hypothetical protein
MAAARPIFANQQSSSESPIERFERLRTELHSFERELAVLEEKENKRENSLSKTEMCSLLSKGVRDLQSQLVLIQSGSSSLSPIERPASLEATHLLSQLQTLLAQGSQNGPAHSSLPSSPLPNQSPSPLISSQSQASKSLSVHTNNALSTDRITYDLYLSERAQREAANSDVVQLEGRVATLERIIMGSVNLATESGDLSAGTRLYSHSKFYS